MFTIALIWLFLYVLTVALYLSYRLVALVVRVVRALVRSETP